MSHIENLKAAIAAVEAQPELELSHYRTETECGTLFCVAGLLPEVRHFQALGVRRHRAWTYPELGRKGVFATLHELFGGFGAAFDDDEGVDSAYLHLCASRHSGTWDRDLLAGLDGDHTTDKQLALARLRKALAIRQGEQTP